jgi:hypothetical protein
VRSVIARRRRGVEAEVEHGREGAVGARGGKLDGRECAARCVVGHEEGIKQLRVAAELHPLDCPHQPPSKMAPGSKR